VALSPNGANLTTFEFTTTTPALYVVGYGVFQSRKNVSVLKTRKATRGVVYFYNAGVETRSRSSWSSPEFTATTPAL
jgi:hypothetical protein